jgi:hypothetical protein
VDRLLAAAGEALQVVGDRQVVTLTCTVVEGTFCWFGEDAQSGSLPRELAREIIDELGGIPVEHANLNEVAIRCSRADEQDAEFTCEADWGWGGGWEPLPVE